MRISYSWQCIVQKVKSRNRREDTNLKLTLGPRTGAGDIGRSSNHVSRAQSVLLQADPRMWSIQSNTVGNLQALKCFISTTVLGYQQRSQTGSTSRWFAFKNCRPRSFLISLSNSLYIWYSINYFWANSSFIPGTWRGCRSLPLKTKCWCMWSFRVGAHPGRN